MRQRNLVALGLLVIAALWLSLTAKGALAKWTMRVGHHSSPLVALTATLAVPILAALCSLAMAIDWKIRIAALLALLVCVPFLVVEFGLHPVLAAVITGAFVVEEFLLIPAVNKRWIRRRTRSVGD